MTTIARIVVESELQNKRQLFMDFITESKTLLTNGEKHQFVLLPAGFLTFASNDLIDVPISEPLEQAAKQKWNEKVEAIKEQALTEFYHAFDDKMLQELKSVAKYLTIGINGKVTPDSKEILVQLVLVYDLQSGKPLHWTGKTYPNLKERNYLIKMPIDSHFMKQKIEGKRIAVFGCHDLSIFIDLCTNSEPPRQIADFTPPHETPMIQG